MQYCVGCLGPWLVFASLMDVSRLPCELHALVFPPHHWPVPSLLPLRLVCKAWRHLVSRLPVPELELDPSLVPQETFGNILHSFASLERLVLEIRDEKAEINISWPYLEYLTTLSSLEALYLFKVTIFFGLRSHKTFENDFC